jgi:hypothetical protein
MLRFRDLMNKLFKVKNFQRGLIIKYCKEVKVRVALMWLNLFKSLLRSSIMPLYRNHRQKKLPQPSRNKSSDKFLSRLSRKYRSLDRSRLK